MNDSIGKTLKEARLQKGLSIEELSRLTHIKIYFLEALENDQLEQIPSLVQTKGFIRLISDQVGIPSQPLLAILSGKNTVLETTNKDTKPPLHATGNSPSAPADDVDENVLSARKKKPTIVNSIPHDYGHPNENDPTRTEPYSKSIFKEIGETIRKRRETLGLSLSDVEDYIHIREVYLQQIENGDIHELPSTVQARGMLNNYLNFLDLDTENILLKFAYGVQSLYTERTFHQEKEKKKAKQVQRVKIFQPIWKKLFSPDLLIGTTVILAILVFSIWGAYQLSSMPEPALNRGEGSISNVLIETLPVTTGTPQANGGRSSSLNANASGATGNNIDPGLPTSTTVFTGSGPLQINIISNQRAYLRVIVDGKSVFDGRVLPGNAYPYNGNQQIEILTGNAGAIKLAYLLNGEQNDMGVLGANGEVKSLIFTNQGIFTPTPLYTPSVTGTSIPSATTTLTPTPEEPTITPYIPN